MEQSNGSINSNYNNYCQYRLPCGYCEKTGRMCFNPNSGWGLGAPINDPIYCSTSTNKTDVSIENKAE